MKFFDLNRFLKRGSKGFLFCLFVSFEVSASQVFTVTNSNDSGAGSLRQAIINSNTVAATVGNPNIITINSGLNINVTTGGVLPLITQPVLVNTSGAGQATVSGGNTNALFVAYQGALTLQNLILSGGVSRGGTGGNGWCGAGGGGLGAGGAVFASRDVPVTLIDCNAQNNQAIGGQPGGTPGGGNGAGGGGGGMWQGHGGNASSTAINYGNGAYITSAGGGGGAGSGATGGDGYMPLTFVDQTNFTGIVATPGSPGTAIGLGSGGSGSGGGVGGAFPVQSGGASGGGGGGGNPIWHQGNLGTFYYGTAGGGGGIGGGNAYWENDGLNPFGIPGSGGTGGDFGGGGGSNQGYSTGSGALGGFGGGSGGGNNFHQFFYGRGGWGGGWADIGSSQGGWATGGAIFSRVGSPIIIQAVNQDMVLSGNSVVPGSQGFGPSGLVPTVIGQGTDIYLNTNDGNVANNPPSVPHAATPFNITFNVGANRTVTSNGTIVSDYALASTLSGNFIKQGTGLLVLNGANDFWANTVDIQGGTLQILGDSGLGRNTNSVTFNNNSALKIGSTFTTARSLILSSAGIVDTNGFNLTVTNPITGVGQFIKQGLGTLTLNSANTYGAVVGTQINGGIVSITNMNNLGTGPVGFTNFNTQNSQLLFSANGLNMNRAVTLGAGGGGFANSGAWTTSITGVIGESVAGQSFAYNGQGVFLVQSNNTYTGGTFIGNTTLDVGSIANLGAAGGVTLQGAATLRFNTGFTLNRAVTVSTGGGILSTTNGAITVPISGAIGQINGSQQITFAGPGIFILQAPGTITGGANITGGTVEIGADNHLGPSGTVSLNNTTLRFNNTLNNSYTFTHPINMATGNGTLTTTAAGVTATLSGVISETGPRIMTFAGPGSFILQAANTYTGGSMITGGIVEIGANNHLGTAGSITLNTGLRFNSNFSLNHPIILSGAANSISTTNAGVVTTISSVISETGGSQNLNFAGPGAIILQNNNTYSGVTNVTGGTVEIGSMNNLGSGSVTLAGGGGIRFNTNAINFNHALTLSGVGGGIFSSTTAGITTTVSTPIGQIGVQPMTFAGPGAFILQAASTYSGITNITGGVVEIGAVNQLGTGTGITIFNGASIRSNTNGLNINRSLTLAGTGVLTATGAGITSTVSGVISETGGSQTLVISGPGAWILSGVNTYTGSNLVMNASILEIGANNNLGNSGGVTLSDNSFLRFNSSMTLGRLITLNTGGGGFSSTLAGVTVTVPGATISEIGGSQPMTYAGPGTFLVQGAQNYSGLSNINGGTVQITALNDLGTAAGINFVNGGNLQFNTTGVNLTRTLTLNNPTGGKLSSTTAGVATSVSGLITGAGALEYAGPGNLLLLNAANNYAGGTVISGGTVQIGFDSALGNAGPITFLNNGKLVLSVAVNSARNVNINNPSGGTLDIGNFNSNFSGQFTGPGILTILGTGGLTLSYNGLSTNTGGYVLPAGTFSLTGNTSTLKGPIVNNSHVIFDQSINAIPVNTGIYAGVISGPGDLLIKATNSSVNLTGANTFTGGITVQSGTLFAGAVNSLPPGAGPTLATAGAITLQGTSILSLQPIPPGFSQIIGDLTGAAGTKVDLGNQTLTLGSTLNAPANTAMLGIIQGVGGNLIKQGNSKFTLAGLNTYSGTTQVLGGTLTVSVPNGLIPGGVSRIAAGATLEINGGNVAGGINGGTGPGGLATGTLLVTSAFTPTAAPLNIDTIAVGPAGNMTLNFIPTFNNLNVNGNGINALLTLHAPLTVANGQSLTVQGLNAGATGVVDLASGSGLLNNGTVNVLPFGYIYSTAVPPNTFTNNGILNLAGGAVNCPLVGGANSTLNVIGSSTTVNNITTTAPNILNIHVFAPAVFTINNDVTNFTSFIIDSGASTVVNASGLVATPSAPGTPIYNNGNFSFNGGTVMNPIVGDGLAGTSTVTVTSSTTTQNTISNVKTVNVDSGILSVTQAITGFQDFNINPLGMVNLGMGLDMSSVPNANLNISGVLNTQGQTITGSATATVNVYSSFNMTDPINGFGTFVVKPLGNITVTTAPTYFGQFKVEVGGSLALNTDLTLQAAATLDLYGDMQMNNHNISGTPSSIININNSFATYGNIQGVGTINASAGTFTINTSPVNFANLNITGSNTTFLNTDLIVPDAATVAVGMPLPALAGGILNMGGKNITLGAFSSLNISGNLSTTGQILPTVGALNGYLIDVQNSGQFMVNNPVTGYQSLTVENGGTVTVNNGGSLSNSVVMNGGTLNIKGGTVFGNIAGPGTLNVGTTLTPTGLINVAQLNILNNAILNMPNAITANNLNVNAGGTLVMTNDVIGSVTNGGTITHTATNLRTINGNFVQSGQLNLTLADAANYSQFLVTGATTLNGGVINLDLPTGGGDIISGETYAIIETGSFTANPILPTLISPPSQILSFKPTLNGNRLQIVAHVRTYEEENTNPVTEELAKTFDLINHSGNRSKFIPVLNVLNQQDTVEKFERELSQFLPIGVNEETVVATQNVMELMLTRIETQLANTRVGFNSTQTRSGYAAGDMAENHSSYGPMVFGNSAKQRARHGVSGYTASTGGFGLLWDTPVTQYTRVGVAASYAGSFVRTDDFTRNTTTISSVQGALFASGNYGPLFLDSLFGLGQNRYHGKRNMPSIGATATGDYSGNQYTAKVKGGFGVPFYEVELAPMASLQYLHLRQNGYSEKGPGPNQIVEQKAVTGMQLGMGARLAHISNAEEFLPEIHAMYIHDVKQPNLQVTSRFIDGGASFISTGPLPPKSGLNVGGSITAALLDGSVLLSGNYDLEAKKSYMNHAFSLKFRWLF